MFKLEKDTTHNDVVIEINKVMSAFNETIESDCLGDMMSFLDDEKIKYPSSETFEREDYFNQFIREKYMHANADMINRLHTIAQSLAQKEIYKSYYKR